jgi:chromosome segregation ATPase
MRCSTLLSVALVGAFACSCKSTGVDAAHQTSGALRDTYKALEAASATIDAVKADLTVLKQADGDLAAQFKTFSSDLAALKSERAQIVSLRERLHANRDTFNAMWKERAAGIKDAEMRDLAESRRDALAAEFQKISDASQPGRDAVEPWLQSLTDLSSYLEFNLNKEGIAAVAGKIDTAIAGAEPIEQSVDETLSMMQALADRIEAAAPPPPPPAEEKPADGS